MLLPLLSGMVLLTGRYMAGRGVPGPAVAATCARSADEAESPPANRLTITVERSSAADAGLTALYVTAPRYVEAEVPGSVDCADDGGCSGGTAVSSWAGPGSGRPGLGHLGAGDRFVVPGLAWGG